MFESKGRKRFFSNFKHISKIEKAYIAGFFDGEGYLGLNRKKNFGKYHRSPYYYDPVIKILNTNEEVINFLESKLGGFRFKRILGKNWKDAHSLEWKSGIQILPMLKFLFPNLIVKKKICSLLIEFLEWKKGSGRSQRQGCRPYNPEELLKMEEFYLKCKETNHKGAAVTTK